MSVGCKSFLDVYGLHYFLASFAVQSSIYIGEVCLQVADLFQDIFAETKALI